MFDLNKYDLIENYVAERLSPSEKVKFEQLMRDDPALVDEVNKEKQINQLVHQLGLSEAGTKLDHIHKLSRTRKMKNKFLILGGIIITMSASLLFISNDQKNSKVEQKQKIEYKDNFGIDTFKSEIRNKPALENNKEPKEEQQHDLVVEEPVQNELNHDELKNVALDDTTSQGGGILNLKSDTTIRHEEVLDSSAKKNSSTISKIEPVCSGLFLKEYSIRRPCTGQDDGALIFSENDIKGGTQPYSSRLYHIDQEEFVENHLLVEGNYFLEISDANGCVDTISGIEISAKWCVKRIDDTFSPYFGETWVYPEVPNLESYNLLITNVSQAELLNKRVDLFEETEWNGQLDDGTTIKEGLYLIKISDKNQVYYTGTLTVIK